MAFIDFAELKKSVTIEQVTILLELELKKQNSQLRGPCPACGSSGDRTLVITPEKQVWYCFAEEKGGDLIALVAHIKALSMKDAADWIHSSLTVPQKVAQVPTELQPLSHIDHNHELLIALGFVPEDAAKLGIGYAKKGIMAGHVAVPIRMEDGTLVGYIGIKDCKLPPTFKFPDANVVSFPKKTA